MNDLARRLAISTTMAAAVVVIGFLLFSVDSVHEQIATVDQSQTVTATKLAAIEAKAEDRIINLPEDGGAYYTSVFVRTDWRRRPQDRTLIAWFGSNRRLLSLRSQTHYNVYTERTPLFKMRYSRTITALPAVRVQAADGRVTYQSSAVNLPKSADGLADEISGCFFKRRKDRHKPAPAPKPDVDVDVDVMPAPVIPDIVVPVKPAFPWALAVLAGFLAVVAALWGHFRS